MEANALPATTHWNKTQYATKSLMAFVGAAVVTFVAFQAIALFAPKFAAAHLGIMNHLVTPLAKALSGKTLGLMSAKYAGTALLGAGGLATFTTGIILIIKQSRARNDLPVEEDPGLFRGIFGGPLPVEADPAEMASSPREYGEGSSTESIETASLSETEELNSFEKTYLNTLAKGEDLVEAFRTHGMESLARELEELLQALEASNIDKANSCDTLEEMHDVFDALEARINQRHTPQEIIHGIVESGMRILDNLEKRKSKAKLMKKLKLMSKKMPPSLNRLLDAVKLQLFFTSHEIITAPGQWLLTSEGTLEQTVEKELVSKQPQQILNETVEVCNRLATAMENKGSGELAGKVRTLAAKMRTDYSNPQKLTETNLRALIEHRIQFEQMLSNQ